MSSSFSIKIELVGVYGIRVDGESFALSSSAPFSFVFVAAKAFAHDNDARPWNEVASLLVAPFL